MNELIPSENRGMTAADIRAGVQLIQEVMAATMIKDIHYGTIPGTPKPTLYKAGSEKILTTFRIAAYPKEIDDLSTHDEARYRVKVHGIHQPTGMLIGVGIGECSSMEEKYKWRKPVCPEEFDEATENRRRVKWNKGNPPYQVKQIRTQPADVANTILKMAKKRAQIDMTLTATAASDVFDQDLEDLPEGIAGDDTTKPPLSSTVKKKEKSAKEKTVNDTLADELAAYCPDEAMRPALLMQISAFPDDNGKTVTAFDISKMSNKWAGTALGKLRELAKKKGSQGTTDLPANCPKNPRECEHSGWVDSVASCGPEAKTCPFNEAKG
ncbi:MAG: hypothetical protein ABIJ57_07785 [Pseudomonadota bacterium]